MSIASALVHTMPKHRLEVDSGSSSSKKAREDGSSSLKPGHKLNPHTALPYTPRYFELFRKRIALPVWEYQDKFLDLLAKHQVTDSFTWVARLGLPRVILTLSLGLLRNSPLSP